MFGQMTFDSFIRVVFRENREFYFLLSRRSQTLKLPSLQSKHTSLFQFRQKVRKIKIKKKRNWYYHNNLILL